MYVFVTFEWPFLRWESDVLTSKDYENLEDNKQNFPDCCRLQSSSFCHKESKSF